MLKGLFTILVVVALFIGGTFSLLQYERFFAPQWSSVKRETFENSKAYVHGMIEDLASYKREYDRAKTEDEKEQILNYVDSLFATFDENNIENYELRAFLQLARN